MDGRIERIRLDRTFVEDGTRWVVDYKITGREGGDPESFLRLQEEKYRPDMQRYQRVLRQWDVVRCVARCSFRCWEPSARFCSAAMEIRRDETLSALRGLHLVD